MIINCLCIYFSFDLPRFFPEILPMKLYDQIKTYLAHFTDKEIYRLKARVKLLMVKRQLLYTTCQLFCDLSKKNKLAGLNRADFLAKLSKIVKYEITKDDSSELFRDLIDEIEDFLVLGDFKIEKKLRKQRLVTILLKRKEQQLSKEQIQSILKKNSALIGLESRSMQYDLQMLLLTLEKQENRNIVFDTKRSSHLLETYLIASKLKQACILLSYQQTNSALIDDDFTNYIIDYIEKPAQKKLKQEPIIQLYYLNYRLILKGERTDFEELRKLAIGSKNTFSKEEIYELYALLINWAISQIHQQKMEHQELLSLYQEAIDNHGLYVHGQIPVFQYSNIASLGVKLGEFDWVEQFLQDEKHHLDASVIVQNHYYNFNMAKIFFGRNELEKAKETLALIPQFKDVRSECSRRLLQVKIYYELDVDGVFFDILENYLNSFTSYLNEGNRKHLTHVEKFKNFILAMKRLRRCNVHVATEITKFIESLDNLKPLPERIWIKAKAIALL